MKGSLAIKVAGTIIHNRLSQPTQGNRQCCGGSSGLAYAEVLTLILSVPTTITSRLLKTKGTVVAMNVVGKKESEGRQ